MHQPTTRHERLCKAWHTLPILVLVHFAGSAAAQDVSLIRVWNEQTLKAIRNDLARPPVHARNLFHVNAAMYDAWAAYDTQAQPWLLGRTVGNYTCPFPALTMPTDIEEARKEAISHAMYRLLRHRFLNSPGYAVTYGRLDHLMDSLGYDRTFTGVDPTTGGAAALGNLIAQEYIAFGQQDGSNENGNYANQYYTPVNAGLPMFLPGNPAMADPNRWQPITLPNSIDQAGNPLSSTPPFVGAEWGNVTPFSLTGTQSDTYTRDGYPWKVYLDPGAPAQLDMSAPDGLSSVFKWNHLLVSIWQSHLDPAQGVTWDASPGAHGNNNTYPTTPAEYSAFYDLVGGGDNSTGHDLNPVTGQPYAANPVDRGDYTRVLAEFWADGVDSETPPGHWFEILHNVMDLAGFERRWMGQGPELDELEYDVKMHFVLGSAMHDAAITAWGIKGYYDSVRPVSAIRFMGDRGQCTDAALPRYDPAGVPLVPGYIEQVGIDDNLVGADQEHLNKIKLFTYKGPGYVTDPATDVAGCGWILSENWWPYQRPTFVTPPFAGFVSGHSTFSRTAAEVLTSVTGSPFFPGGMIEYVIPQNEFLVFEDGPSEDVRLQWATYRDASDACSLSRIWGGIHPPMDDIPGRVIGMQLGPQVVDVANELFYGGPPRVITALLSNTTLGPNEVGTPFTITLQFDRSMDISSTVVVYHPADDPYATPSLTTSVAEWIGADRIRISSTLLPGDHDLMDIDMVITGAMDNTGKVMAPFAMMHAYRIDTHSPNVTDMASTRAIYAIEHIGPSAVGVTISFDEPCDVLVAPLVELSSTPAPATFLSYGPASSEWINDHQFVAVYELLSQEVDIATISVSVTGAVDLAGNGQQTFSASDLFAVDTRRPASTSVTAGSLLLNLDDVGSIAQVIDISFDESMDQAYSPMIAFTGADPLGGALSRLGALSSWTTATDCRVTFSLANTNEEFADLDVLLNGFLDLAGNEMQPTTIADLFSMDTRRPVVGSLEPSVVLIADANTGNEGLHVQVMFDGPMDTSVMPLVQPVDEIALQGTLVYSLASSTWLDSDLFEAVFHVTDAGVETADIGFVVSFARDASGNSMMQGTTSTTDLAVDTRNPVLGTLIPDPAVITDAALGTGLLLRATFSEAMDQTTPPTINIGQDGTLSGTLIHDAAASQWSGPMVYDALYGIQASEVQLEDIGCTISAAKDVAGNSMALELRADVLDIYLTGVGVEEVGSNNPPILLPNPLRSSEVLFVTSEVSFGQTDLLVNDAQGRLVFQQRILLDGATRQAVPLPGLSAGLYEVALVTAQRRFLSRILILDL